MKGLIRQQISSFLSNAKPPFSEMPGEERRPVSQKMGLSITRATSHIHPLSLVSHHHHPFIAAEQEPLNQPLFEGFLCGGRVSASIGRPLRVHDQHALPLSTTPQNWWESVSPPTDSWKAVSEELSGATAVEGEWQPGESRAELALNLWDDWFGVLISYFSLYTSQTGIRQVWKWPDGCNPWQMSILPSVVQTSVRKSKRFHSRSIFTQTRVLDVSLDCELLFKHCKSMSWQGVSLVSERFQSGDQATVKKNAVDDKLGQKVTAKVSSSCSRAAEWWRKWCIH